MQSKPAQLELSDIQHYMKQDLKEPIRICAGKLRWTSNKPHIKDKERRTIGEDSSHAMIFVTEMEFF